MESPVLCVHMYMFRPDVQPGRLINRTPDEQPAGNWRRPVAQPRTGTRPRGYTVYVYTCTRLRAAYLASTSSFELPGRSAHVRDALATKDHDQWFCPRASSDCVQ